MAKFFVRLLVLLILAAAVLGFFAVVAGAEETVRASCAWVVEVLQFVRGLFDWPSHLSGAQALAGILLLLPLFVLIVIQVGHWVFHRPWFRRVDQVCYSPQGSNGPIYAAEDDCLERGAFVDHLAEVMSGPYVGNDAFYVALYGDWGSGKTSVINLVKEKLQRDRSILFVDFPSWEHEDRKDVPFVLFAQIARRVWWKLDIPLAVLLFRYAVLLVPRRLMGIAGPVEWIGDLLVRLSNVMTSAAELRARIGERLERLKAKIVVVVDDLDRMEADDVRSLLRVIRTTGDVSHFAYCMLSAREHLERSVEKLYMEDKEASCEKATEARDMARDYIQKLVNLEIDLPAVDPASLASIFVRRLNAALQNYGEPGIKEDCAALKLFSSYVTTFRAMIRLLNELIVRVGYFHSRRVEDDTLAVNLDDLIAISIIHLYDVDFWRSIYEHREIFIGANVDAFLNEDRYQASEIKKKFGLEDVERGDVRTSFLSDYLDVARMAMSDDADFQIRIDQREAEHGRRLKSARCFKSYYDGLVPNLAGIGFVRGVMERLDDEDSLVKYLVMQNERGVLLRCLDYLEVADPIQDPEKRHVYLRALVRLAELKLKPEEPIWRDPLGISAMFDPVTHIMRCATFMLQKLHPDQSTESGAELMRVFRTDTGVVAMAQMIRADDRKTSQRHYDYRFSDADYQEMLKLFLARIKKLQREGRLVDYTEEEELRRTWLVLLKQGRVNNEEEERSAYRKLLFEDAGSYSAVLHVLLPYRYYANRAIDAAVPMYFDAVAKDFDIARVRIALESATKGYPMKDTAERVLKNLDWCLKEYNENGVWPHPDNQMEVTNG